MVVVDVIVTILKGGSDGRKRNFCVVVIVVVICVDNDCVGDGSIWLRRRRPASGERDGGRV